MLDKILLSSERFEDYNVKIGPPLQGIAADSDHSTITAMPKNTIKTKSFQYLKAYDYRPSALNKVIQYLNNMQFFENCDNSNVNNLSAVFLDIVMNSFLLVPYSIVCFIEHDSPWLTPVIKLLINRRWDAYRNKNFKVYHILKIKIKTMITEAKLRWANANCKSSNRVWQLIKTINRSNCQNAGILFEDGSFDRIMNLFKSYYNYNLHVHKFDFTDIPCDLHIVTTAKTVFRIIDSIPVNKCSGIDGLSMYFIKIIAPFIAEPLSIIINKCFEQCTFPDNWKQSIVIPVPKCSKPSIDQFRPITLISVFSKVLEKVFILNFKYDFINHYGTSQHAYRPCALTNTALAEYTMKLSRLRLNVFMSKLFVLFFTI